MIDRTAKRKAHRARIRDARKAHARRLLGEESKWTPSQGRAGKQAARRAALDRRGKS